MQVSTEKTLCLESGVIKDEGCVDRDAEEAALMLDALRMSMSGYIATYRKLKMNGIAFIIISIVVAIIAIVLPDMLQLSLLSNIIFISPIILLIGVYKLWKMSSIRPEYKIRAIGKVEYPLALYKEQDGRYIIFDAGASVPFQEYSFPALRDTDAFGSSVERVRGQISDYFDYLGMGSGSQVTALRNHDQFDDFVGDRRIEVAIEDPMVELAERMGEDNIERTEVRAPVIESSSPIIQEVQALLQLTRAGPGLPGGKDVTRHLRAKGLYLEIPPDELVAQAEVFRKWSAEALEQDIMILVQDLVDELQCELSDISHILTSMPALIEATMPYSMQIHENHLNYHFCPQCRSTDFELTKREVDVRGWVNQRILGNALDDPDLQHPHEHGDHLLVEKARDDIEDTLLEHLPMTEEVYPIMLAGLRELIADPAGVYRCPKCNYVGEGMVVPRSFHPLASAFVISLKENAQHMQEKADVIIRNVHDVIMNKESKLVALGPYEQSMQQAEQNKIQVEGELRSAEAVTSMVNDIRKR